MARIFVLGLALEQYVYFEIHFLIFINIYFIGNKTECALLGFVMDLGADYRRIRKANPDTTFTKVYTFNSAR